MVTTTREGYPSSLHKRYFTYFFIPKYKISLVGNNKNIRYNKGDIKKQEIKTIPSFT